MSRRPLWLALCVVSLICSPAVADVGSVSLTVTPLQTPGTLDVDLMVAATTTGAATPATGDAVYMFGSMYYPTPWPSRTFSTYSGASVSRTGVTNVFEHTFSFTLPNEGHWGYYGWVYGFTAAGGTTSDYLYGTTDISVQQAAPIPTATLPGMLFLGVLLAGIGVFLLRRS